MSSESAPSSPEPKRLKSGARTAVDLTQYYDLEGLAAAFDDTESAISVMVSHDPATDDSESLCEVPSLVEGATLSKDEEEEEDTKPSPRILAKTRKMENPEGCNDDDEVEEENEPWNDDSNEKRPWILPKGSELIIKQLAAEEIFFQTVNVILDEPRVVNHRALDDLLRSFPGLCHRTYEINWDNDETRVLYPMAILCCLKPNLELLQFVYQINPDALFHKESVKGTLPFHYACTFQASPDVVSWMIEVDEEFVKTPRNDLMYPLHLAAYFKASAAVVDRLLEVWPKAAELTDAGSWTVLHAAASGQTSLEIVRKLHSIQPTNILALDGKSRTPLHLACWKKGNPEVISFLLACAPQALNMEDEGSESSLFRASRNQSLEVLRIMLPDNPPLDDLGASLLHFAALDNTCDVVEYLLDRFPEMVFIQTRDRDRYSPLHGACHFNAPLENVKALVKRAPVSLLMENGHGKTPLQTAESCDASDELIAFLTEATQEQRKLQSTSLGSTIDNQDDMDPDNQVFPNIIE